MSRTYTLSEAQALLPEARQRIEEAAAMLTELRRMLGQRHQGRSPGSISEEAAGLESAFERAMVWFADHELQVKGIDPALLDFPARAMRDGEWIDVLLCWRGDEPAIAYYHPPETGYRGREPVALLDEV